MRLAACLTFGKQRLLCDPAGKLVERQRGIVQPDGVPMLAAELIAARLHTAPHPHAADMSARSIAERVEGTDTGMQAGRAQARRDVHGEGLAGHDQAVILVAEAVVLATE